MGRRAVRGMHASFSMTSRLAPDGGRPPMPLLVRSIPSPGVSLSSGGPLPYAMPPDAG
jgi:hypothetical protein